ncbi:hypothetical protein [Gilvimarinus chinensis]|uniref:hypothetical protein n=1 Tax=Gilvimarinus chinensis TaxID=396005 RepID=UPI0003812DBD|nr:hypothetical protein [Gilvimarinus chinensis]
MEFDLLQTVAATVKYRLIEQPEKGAQKLALQLGLSCADIKRIAENDPSLCPDIFIRAALHLDIAPDFIRIYNEHRLQG